MKTVLVVGGAGYVGSHCAKAFRLAGWEVVVFDDLSRGHRDSVRFGALIEGSLLDQDSVKQALADVKPDLVAHFAAVAYVGESMADPSLYYRVNLVGSLNLLDAMRAAGIDSLLFSGTCAVYGDPVRLPIDEDHPRQPINPYGRSKLAAERIIEDFVTAYGLKATLLRYFNAAGCDAEGELGERHEPETHAIPLAIRAALDPAARFEVLGTDFDTRDGSAVRDYIHVSDLARAHVMAGEQTLAAPGFRTFNLGTGHGTSVLELLAAVERATGQAPGVRYAARRGGDPAELVACARKAERELGWRASESGIDHIVATALAWQRGMLADRPRRAG
ncbi:MAG: UDP-glucose 4-epimerase [uncultured Sphingomonadaceae bacterium]|uniref:UDP-glucose 4-epimerase n=1 Tax=uncultured Sphingomonadaceae bacterium TaxID=169976 RepID=A0A6J4TWY2_9SPHN|nr:MAG: UDP-glucose 4-epimerase [uncultured Sphingomonadaceae bacterium]